MCTGWIVAHVVNRVQRPGRRAPSKVIPSAEDLRASWICLDLLETNIFKRPDNIWHRLTHTVSQYSQWLSKTLGIPWHAVSVCNSEILAERIVADCFQLASETLAPRSSIWRLLECQFVPNHCLRVCLLSLDKGNERNKRHCKHPKQFTGIEFGSRHQPLSPFIYSLKKESASLNHVGGMFVCSGPGDNLKSNACFQCQDSVTEINGIYPKADWWVSPQRCRLPCEEVVSHSLLRKKNVATHKKLFETIKLTSMLYTLQRSLWYGTFQPFHQSKCKGAVHWVHLRVLVFLGHVHCLKALKPGNVSQSDLAHAWHQHWGDMSDNFKYLKISQVTCQSQLSIQLPLAISAHLDMTSGATK